MRNAWVALTSLSVAALALGATFLSSSGCIALVCFEGDPCANGSGGAGTGATSTNDATNTTNASNATATATAGTMANTGSTGTGPACTNPSLCDGIDCLGGACTNCICEPVEFDLGMPLGRLAVGDSVFVIGSPGGGPEIYSVPKTFDPANTTPAPIQSIPDAGGFIAASSSKVAYSPTTDLHLVFCNGNFCGKTAADTLPALANGLAFDGNDVFFVTGAPANEIDSYAFAIPAGSAKFPPTNESPGSGQGPNTIRTLNGDIYWTDLDGCLYAQSNVTVGSTGCLSNSDQLHSADLAVAMSGVFIAQTTGAELYRVIVNIPSHTEVAQFVPDDNGMNIQATAPIAADSLWFYVGQPGSRGVGLDVYKYVSTGSPKVLSFTTMQPISGIDASDAKYLFFTAGQKLYRWAKPPKI